MPLSQLCGAAATLEDLLSYHDERFVRSAYQTLLGRDPDTEGLRYYLENVRAGVGKVEILSQLHHSSEGKSRQAMVNSLDEDIRAHRRFKTPLLGLLFRFKGSTATRAFSAIEEKIQLIVPENQKAFVDLHQRFVHIAYHAILGRTPDADGRNFYVQSLKNGVPAMDVLAQLRESVEGKSRWAEIAKLFRVIKVHQRLKVPVLGILLHLLGERSADRSSKQFLRAVDNNLHVLTEARGSQQQASCVVVSKLQALRASHDLLQRNLRVIEDSLVAQNLDVKRQLAELHVKVSEIERLTKSQSYAANDNELQRPEGLDPYYFRLIKQSALFDVAWYLRHYQSKFGINTNPLSHYLTFGVQEGLNPSPRFDTKAYLHNNPDVVLSDLHPFIHFVAQGRNEGRSALPEPPQEYVSRYSTSGPEFIPRLALDVAPVAKAARVICFYLPQFHPIPENDAWWGEGFTEWSNVKPAKPQFDGHYQPHIPHDYLGYYNLLDRSTQQKQIDLARQYGVEGFCFYLYWFSGYRLLERPLDNYLQDPTLDLPFCVCWANENWSRQWDGLDKDLLMVQHYSEADDIAFIHNVAKYLRDARYIRIRGKPLLLVYRPNLFPSMKATSARWRAWCRENGFGEIYLAYPQSFERVDPAIYGFDAAIEFPPNNYTPPNITPSISPKAKDFQSTIYDWRFFVERSDEYEVPGYKLFRGACTSWDNTPRKKNRGVVFHNSCPTLFAKWLTNAFVDTANRFEDPDEQIVFVNAWNEWAEGAHLEPDQRHGYAWLQSIRDAHIAALAKRTRILIIGHDAHPHGAQLICLNLVKYSKTQFNFDVELILLGDGSLIPKYAEYANVHRFDLAGNDHQATTQFVSSFREKGINVAIVNTSVSGLLVPYLKEGGFRVISLVHEMPGVLNAYALHEHATNIANLADKVVFPARQVQEGFESFIGRRLSQAVIRPQGLYMRSLLQFGADKEQIRIAVRAKLGIPAHAKLIMCAGYADHRKGFDLFVRSCVKVIEQVPDTYALWVGHLDRDFVDKSMQPASTVGYRDRIMLIGLVDHPEEYYVAADVYALTSREDPFPSVVMEALDSLTPVVAFEGAGGFEDLLRKGCGLLVAAEDYLAFAEAMVSLLLNPEKAQVLAATGQEIVRTEYNFRHYLFDLLEIANYPLYKVSVIVPNYNYARHIRQRLETIVAQNFPVYELIVLDDASLDDSVDLIKEFLSTCHLPNRLVVNDKNSGSVFRQWRKGIELARGDLVWIAEADDLAEPTLLENLVAFFKAKDVMLAYCQSKQISENDEILSENYFDYTKDVGDYWREDYVCDGNEEIKRALCIKNTIPNVSAVLFRRDSLIASMSEIGNSIYDYKVAGDWLVYLHMARSGKVGFSAKPRNSHRRHTQSVTNRSNHLDEVISLQGIAASFANLTELSSEKAQSYIEYLHEYFEQQLSPLANTA